MYQSGPSEEWWDHTKSARPPRKRDLQGHIMYESTHSSRDGQFGIIPIPGRRPRGSRSAIAQSQHPQAILARAGPNSTALPTHNSVAKKALAHANTQRIQNSSLHSSLVQNFHSPFRDGGNKDNGSIDNNESRSENEDMNDEYEENLDPDEDENDGSGNALAEMSSAEGSLGMDPLTADERRELERYRRGDRDQIQMCMDGRISVNGLMSGMLENQAKLKQGLKRARWEVSGENKDEDENIQDQRVRRTKRGRHGTNRYFDTKVVGGQQMVHNTFGKSLSPLWSQHDRQETFVKTLHRPTIRPVGSAVQRLHNDPLRRPAPRATEIKEPDFSYQHQQYKDMDGRGNAIHNAHNVAEGSRLSQLSHHPGNTLSGSLHNHQQGQGAHNVGNPSGHVGNSGNTGQPATHRRAYLQAKARATQDDPFFSDELFEGMLNGQPDNNHVGSMYTVAQQKEHDEYYRRLMMPRPRPANALQNPMPPSPQDGVGEAPSVFVSDLLDPNIGPLKGQGDAVMRSEIPYDFRTASVHANNARPLSQVPPAGVSQTATESDLVDGDIAGWNPEWSAFVDFHDAEPVLRA